MPAGRGGEVFSRKIVAEWMRNSVPMYSAKRFKIIRQVGILSTNALIVHKKAQIKNNGSAHVNFAVY